MADSSVLNNEPGQPSNPAVARFTAGPWFACPSHDGIAWTESRAISHMEFEDAAEPTDIAHTTRGWPPGVAEANARLIAAAPDLAEALDTAPILSKYHGHQGFETERFIADYEAWRMNCRAALSKAIPPTRPMNPGSAPNTDEPNNSSRSIT